MIITVAKKSTISSSNPPNEVGTLIVSYLATTASILTELEKTRNKNRALELLTQLGIQVTLKLEELHLITP